MSASLIQLQWEQQGWGHKPPGFHQRISKSVEIFELFTAGFYTILLFVCVCCAGVMFCCLLSSVWLTPGLHSFTGAQQQRAHAQSSFNISSNPCSSCRLNASILLIRCKCCDSDARCCLTPTCAFSANAFISPSTNGLQHKEERIQRRTESSNDLHV